MKNILKNFLESLNKKQNSNNSSDNYIENKIITDFFNIKIYDDLIEYVRNLKIDLTNEQIKEYLEVKEIEDYPNIEQRIENQKIMKVYFSSLDKNDNLYEIMQ